MNFSTDITVRQVPSDPTPCMHNCSKYPFFFGHIEFMYSLTHNL